MGLMSTPLDPGTCMVASLSMGIGIDYAVHFLWRRRWRGLSLEQTCRNVGPSIVFNAVEVASGFAVMIAADTVPLSRFGLLVMAAMLIATIATFTILPALTRLNAPGGPDIVGGEDTGDGRRQKLSEVARRGA
jgi:predicted RND superfamily exporter protein